jgi:hypothetical protein
MSLERVKDEYMDVTAALRLQKALKLHFDTIRSILQVNSDLEVLLAQDLNPNLHKLYSN